MIETVRKTRDVVIKHIMHKVSEEEITVDAGLRLIAAFDEEYQIMTNCVERYQRACFHITDDRIVILGG